jgi:CRISPR-associated protein Csb2
MFALAVRYLTGRVVATQVNNREEPEWPPHPGRFFMALVSAWGTRGRDSAERNALAWLETLPPPSLRASGCSHAGEAVSFFVPVNDDKGNPDGRHKAERHFPSVVPDEDTVHFIWDADAPVAHRTALAELCRNVTYLGHSSTLVQAWLADKAPEPNLVPAEGNAPMRLRVARAGRLDQLIADFEATDAKGQPSARRPGPGAWCGYAPPQAVRHQPPASDLAGDFLVLRRVSGDRLGLPSTLALIEAMRGAVMANAAQPPNEIISGHAADGKPTRRPHVAYVPLADVGHDHADGHLLGLAAVLPRGLSPADSDDCLRAIARVQHLLLGRLGSWDMEGEEADGEGRIALNAQTWLAPARRWATVTPVVLDRFPKKDGDAEEAVARACELVGLPRPVAVTVHPVSLHLGVPTAREFPALPTKAGASRRWHAHAAVVFGDEVAGPILLGAGRFRGYGFFRPLRTTGNAQ